MSLALKERKKGGVPGGGEYGYMKYVPVGYMQSFIKQWHCPSTKKCGK